MEALELRLMCSDLLAQGPLPTIQTAPPGGALQTGPLTERAYSVDDLSDEDLSPPPRIIIPQSNLGDYNPPTDVIA